MFKKNEIYMVEDKDTSYEVICYDISDEYAYCAPFKKVTAYGADDIYDIDITKTVVYSLDEDFCDYPVTAILKQIEPDNTKYIKHSKATDIKEKQLC